MLFLRRFNSTAHRASAALLILSALCSFAQARVIDTADNRSAVQMVARSGGIKIAETDARTGQEFCGWIGIRVNPMTKAFAMSLGMTTPYGAIFGPPLPGSPAALAKIQAGDVITEINGSPLRSWQDFHKTLSGFAPGTSVYFTTYRDGQLIERTVMLDYSKCRRPPRRT